MASDPNEPDLTSERPSWPTTPYRDIQVRIGQALRLQYELPQEVTRPTTHIVDASDRTGRERLIEASVGSLQLVHGSRGHWHRQFQVLS
jgi:hypothetical protein